MSDTYGSLSRNILRFLLNFLVRGILAAVAVYSCAIPIKNYNYWFSWHVILCTLGYIPIMAEALMLFAGDELWSRQLTRKQKYWIHASVISLGAGLITGGSINIIYHTTKSHFATAHGITGLVSLILIWLSLIWGFLAKYSQDLRLYTRPVLVKFIHNSVGLSAFLIGIVSLCLCFYTNWFKYYTDEKSRFVALLGTVMGSLWSLNAALVSGYCQIKTLFM